MAGREKITLTEGLDYYCEGAVMVFTAHYHLRRGYCCRNNCRHCPYQQTTPTTDVTANETNTSE